VCEFMCVCVRVFMCLCVGVGVYVCPQLNIYIFKYADSKWLLPGVKLKLVNTWFLAMLDPWTCTIAPSQNPFIFDFSDKLSRMPLMASVHQSMVVPMDSSRHLTFPHLYEHPAAHTSLLVETDENKSNVRGRSSHFRQRIQGLRQFADALLAEQQRADESIMVSQIIDGWTEVVSKYWKVMKDIEAECRAGHQIFSLEVFALLLPSCAISLSNTVVMTKKGVQSNALIHFCQYFFELTPHDDAQVDVRMLEARMKCVPAAILGIMQLECDKRQNLGETFRSLLLIGLAGAGCQQSAKTHTRIITEIFSVLFLRGSASKCTEKVLKRLPRGKAKSARFLSKFLIHSLFQTLALSSPSSAVQALAAATVIKLLLKFLEKAGYANVSADILDVSFESIALILHLAASQLSVCSTDEIAHGVRLLEVVDVAVSALVFYLHNTKLDLAIFTESVCQCGTADTSSSPSHVLLCASVKVITCQTALTLSRVFSQADAREGGGNTHCVRDENLETLACKARTELDEASPSAQSRLNSGETASKRLLENLLKMGPIVNDSMPLAVEGAKRLENGEVALTDLSAAAVKVLKGLLKLGEVPRSLVKECAPAIAACVSGSSVQERYKTFHQKEGAGSNAGSNMPQEFRRLSQWCDFSDALAASCPLPPVDVIEPTEERSASSVSCERAKRQSIVLAVATEEISETAMEDQTTFVPVSNNEGPSSSRAERMQETEETGQARVPIDGRECGGIYRLPSTVAEAQEREDGLNSETSAGEAPAAQCTEPNSEQTENTSEMEEGEDNGHAWPNGVPDDVDRVSDSENDD